jgi:hypothetical protein
MNNHQNVPTNQAVAKHQLIQKPCCGLWHEINCQQRTTMPMICNAGKETPPQGHANDNACANPPRLSHSARVMVRF